MVALVRYLEPVEQRPEICSASGEYDRASDQAAAVIRGRDADSSFEIDEENRV
jgi:hypothetical protein